MNRLININMGIDSMAKSFLAVHGQGITLKMNYGKKHFPENSVHHRVGEIPSIALKRYPMKDGSHAEEFVQAIMETHDGRRMYFLGLSAGTRNIIWPSSKIREKMLRESCSE